jgi:hypothetical protein
MLLTTIGFDVPPCVRAIVPDFLSLLLQALTHRVIVEQEQWCGHPVLVCVIAFGPTGMEKCQQLTKRRLALIGGRGGVDRSAVKKHVRKEALNHSRPPGFNMPVDLLIQPADRAGTDPGAPQRFPDICTRRILTRAKYISTNVSSTEASRRRYRSMIPVSNGNRRSFGIFSVTRSTCVSRFR